MGRHGHGSGHGGGRGGGRGGRGPGDWGHGWGAGPPWGRPGPGGPGGPPPWLAGIFGMAPPEPARRPKVRRGDVRSAILDVLREAEASNEPINGYQVIQQIGERSGGAWRPSPGSVYPTIQQLQDEGLVENDDERGRRTIRLTADGVRWCDDHAAELEAVWAPFDTAREERSAGGDYADLKPEIGQVMSAIWQIATTGSRSQQQAAIGILVDARRRLYGVLADGDEATDDHDDRHLDEEE